MADTRNRPRATYDEYEIQALYVGEGWTRVDAAETIDIARKLSRAQRKKAPQVPCRILLKRFRKADGALMQSICQAQFV